jgi:hypothetical protein
VVVAVVVVLVVVILHTRVQLPMDPIMHLVMGTLHITEVPTVLVEMAPAATVVQAVDSTPTVHLVTEMQELHLLMEVTVVLVEVITEALVAVVVLQTTKVLVVVDTLEEAVIRKMVTVVAVDPTTQEPTKAIRLDSRQVWAK